VAGLPFSINSDDSSTFSDASKEGLADAAASVLIPLCILSVFAASMSSPVIEGADIPPK
jgi:hypothetical protein